MLQYVAVCCSVLQCVAVCCSVLQHTRVLGVSVHCSVLQCVAVCCNDTSHPPSPRFVRARGDMMHLYICVS